MRPHLLVVLDIGVFAIRMGACYYDPERDVVRPAFVDLIAMRKWRCSFEFGRISRLGWSEQ